ncbi:MAG: NADH-quinone oxidoreductase subunit N [Coriobacteriia bacterium]|nr:NADH-quinone oxidoreductase subunit N [Coriobacteriia bacterium]
MSGYLLLLPEALLLTGAIAALFGEMLPGRDRGTALIAAGLAVLAAAFAWPRGGAEVLFGGLLTADAASDVVRVAVLLLTALWLLWIAGRGIEGERSREAVALALFSSVGGLLLTRSTDLITMFMALELSTMPAYVLMGYRRGDVRGLEGALKYFLLSMLTSLVMLYGLSFLYGISGTTLFSGIAEALPGSGSLGLVAVVLTLAGLFAKLSAAPFHFWAPDAYAGAPAASVAFVSTVPKIAGTLVLVRLVGVFDGLDTLPLVLAIVAAASMVLGNLAALGQSDMRRLMAYSGVAHTGYLLVGLAAAAALGSEYGYLATVFYAIAYSVPSLAIMLVVAEEGDALTDLVDLSSRRPRVAWSMLIWLLSLIGIPPLAGFFGKLYLFGAGIDAGFQWLVIVGVVVSVVSAGYYFRVVRAMFQGVSAEEPADTAAAVAPAYTADAALAFALVATIALGIAAAPVMEALGLTLP